MHVLIVSKMPEMREMQREALVGALGPDTTFDEAGAPHEAIRAALAHQPDVVVSGAHFSTIDRNLEDIVRHPNGEQLAEALRRIAPAAALVLATFDGGQLLCGHAAFDHVVIKDATFFEELCAVAARIATARRVPA